MLYILNDLVCSCPNLGSISKNSKAEQLGPNEKVKAGVSNSSSIATANKTDLKMRFALPMP
jgi:hypothetical protein